MTRIEELNIIIAAKTAEYSAIKTQIDNHIATYKDIMNRQIVGHPQLKGWYVGNFSDDIMNVVFQNGTYRDGSPREEGFTVYYYHNFNEKPRTLEINTACFGSFSVETDGRETMYYNGVSVFCSDKALVANIKAIWDTFLVDFIELEEKMWKISDALRAANTEKHDIEEAEKNVILFAEQDKVVAENPTGYIVAILGETNEKVMHFTYRKRPVIWNDSQIYSDEWTAQVNARRMSRKGYFNYKVIPVANLKVA